MKRITCLSPLETVKKHEGEPLTKPENEKFYINLYTVVESSKFDSNRDLSLFSFNDALNLSLA